MNNQKQQITDSDRINALERCVRSGGPLLLHTSRTPENRGFPGLGFWDGFRDLRGALDALVEAEWQKEAEKQE